MTQVLVNNGEYAIAVPTGQGEKLLPIIVRKRKGSRSLVLRYQPLRHALTLSMPRHVALKHGLRFVEERVGWIARQLEVHPHSPPPADGRMMRYLGQDYPIRHTGGRGLVRMENGAICIPGEAEFMQRRLRQWLIKQAREQIGQSVQIAARRLQVQPKRISLRDTSSRWGSCSHDGALSFSWRLIFTPPEVLDYVACHEVAHIREHNHSPAFWALVASICPDYQKHRAWLRRHGPELYAINL